MNDYTLNHISMRDDYGILPGKHSGSNLAVAGAWDMPARIGKTHHDWGHERGIEPYVSADEIRFGGRDIDFVGWVRADSKNDALRAAYRLYEDMAGYEGTVPLTSAKYGTWNVYVRGQITAEHLRDGYCSIRIPFREPIVDLSGEMPTNKPVYDHPDFPEGIELYDGYGIDGVMFRDMGLMVTEVSGQFSRPAPKASEPIGYFIEPFAITPVGAREITIRAAIIQPDYASFMDVIRGLYALFSKPGLRFMTRPQDALRDFFVKDGFRVRGVVSRPGLVYGFLDVAFTEVGAHLDWNTLADTFGSNIQTEFGNIIIT